MQLLSELYYHNLQLNSSCQSPQSLTSSHSLEVVKHPVPLSEAARMAPLHMIAFAAQPSPEIITQKTVQNEQDLNNISSRFPKIDTFDFLLYVD